MYVVVVMELASARVDHHPLVNRLANMMKIK